MAFVPSYCTNEKCGAIFVDQSVEIENSTHATISVGRGLRCPKCRSAARIANGTFNEKGGKLEFVSGPAITRAVVEQIYGIAQKASNGELTPQQAVAEAAALSPQWGKLLERAQALGLPVFTALLAFIAVALQFQQYNLQVADSVASAKFYEGALSLLDKQAKLLEQINDDKSVEPSGTTEAAPKSDIEAPAIKGPSTRRRDVNKERRQLLKERRKTFPPRPRAQRS
ncbi:hypothetical protein GOL37_27285 [Sinorhizobium medicae]|nr:hypothetical protein [Sinorhizobium medicae]MDX1022721.1 hypothetical protein [Sinorhizobium medicae]MDX2385113.1 hypothetical protein [Sinorhizobium medicae]